MDMKRPASWITLLVVALASCQPLSTGAGDLGLRVSFPTAAFQTKVIPTGTTKIEVSVSGEGMASPAHATLTPSAPSLILRLPVGAKTVSATAFGADGKTLAKGSASATVPLNAKATAIVSLVPAPEASASPSAGPSTPPTTGASGDPNQPQPTVTSTPATAPTPAPTVDPATTFIPTTGGGGGTLATPTPMPSATVSAAITVTDGNANPPLNFRP
jgi:hypothetical protein